MLFSQIILTAVPGCFLGSFHIFSCDFSCLIRIIGSFFLCICLFIQCFLGFFPVFGSILGLLFFDGLFPGFIHRDHS